MLKVTWRRFDQSAKQLVVGQTTINIFDMSDVRLTFFNCRPTAELADALEFFFEASSSNRRFLNGDAVKTSARWAFFFLCLVILHFGIGKISWRTSSNLVNMSSPTSLAADLGLLATLARTDELPGLTLMSSLLHWLMSFLDRHWLLQLTGFLDWHRLMSFLDQHWLLRLTQLLHLVSKAQFPLHYISS